MRRLKQEELNNILEIHAEWLKGKAGRERAILYNCDIARLNLERANLRWADLRRADLRGADLRGADLRWAILKEANLKEANLKEANLKEADLRGANIDYANLPLHCGIVGVKVDERIIRQWCGHIAAFDYIGEDIDIKELLNSELFSQIAKKSHRAKECGLI